MSNIKDFLKTLHENPEAKKLIQEAKEPGSIAEAAGLYADIAEKTGISVSRETIQALLEEKEKLQQAITAEAENVVKEALDENDLETVAGGANPGCDDTHTDGEWCWFTDSCSYLITFYDGTSNQAMPITEEKKEEQSETEFDCSVSQRNYDLTGCYLTSGDL